MCWYDYPGRIIRATAFSFILFVSSSETSTNREVANLKIGASVLQSPRAGLIMARYDAILDQSDRAHLYNHQSTCNYTYNQYPLYGWKITDLSVKRQSDMSIPTSSIPMPSSSLCPQGTGS